MRDEGIGMNRGYHWDTLNPGVVLRCGYCGNLVCFHPKTVVFLGPCRCGNDNWGSPGKWSGHSFGDFDYLWSYVVGVPDFPFGLNITF